MFIVKAVRFEPENTGIQKNLAEFYLDVRQYEKAGVVLHRLLEQMPQNSNDANSSSLRFKDQKNPGFRGFLFPDLPDLDKLVFPQIWEKFLPGNGQNTVGKGAYRILADQD